MALNLILLTLIVGCAYPLPLAIKSIEDPMITQAIIVRNVGSVAVLSLWEANTGHDWQLIYNFPTVMGKNGLAASGAKKEGDGKTPQGTFGLRRAFGYAPNALTKLAYKQVTNEDIWVDDPSSADYNKWIRLPTTARSYEKMKRDDNLYQFGAVIEYNTDQVVPGAGSAIFLHVWRRYDHRTTGCVALSQRNLRKVMSRLNIDRKPVIILNNTDGF